MPRRFFLFFSGLLEFNHLTHRIGDIYPERVRRLLSRRKDLWRPTAERRRKEGRIGLLELRAVLLHSLGLDGMQYWSLRKL
jgi:hypothetical protein